MTKWGWGCRRSGGVGENGDVGGVGSRGEWGVGGVGSRGEWGSRGSGE